MSGIINQFNPIQTHTAALKDHITKEHGGGGLEETIYIFALSINHEVPRSHQTKKAEAAPEKPAPKEKSAPKDKLRTAPQSVKPEFETWPR